MLAALACLQPGIDPVFLILLSSHFGLPPEQHAWIVGASQIHGAWRWGALLYWRLGALLNRRRGVAAAIAMLALGISTLAASGVGAIMAMRAAYGLCAGLIYTRCDESTAAAGRATHAFGTIFLIQLVLSTVSGRRPAHAFASATSPGIAIAALALCPAAMLALLLPDREDRAESRPDAAGEALAAARGLIDISGPALAVAVTMFLFICATMMIWSYAGAAGTMMGLSDGGIGFAVSIGSLCGVIPAFIAFTSRPACPRRRPGRLRHRDADAAGRARRRSRHGRLPDRHLPVQHGIDLRDHTLFRAGGGAGRQGECAPVRRGAASGGHGRRALRGGGGNAMGGFTTLGMAAFAVLSLASALLLAASAGASRSGEAAHNEESASDRLNLA